ncbi:MAG TPA: hypothetical protein VG847_03590 [Chitinophagaceae bacterium]|nr:hypothetical protein [Chitinophagaceae bacterium]
MQSHFFRAHRILLWAALFTVITNTGCNKESVVTPAPPGNETLTTVELIYQNTVNSSDTGRAIWRQLDLTGVNLPDTSAAILNLKANSTYNAQVLILDEISDAPNVDTISNEIKDRENYHLFFFQPEPISASNLVISNTSTDIPVEDGTVTSASGPYLNLVVTRTDLDTNNPPLQIGLTDKLTTGDASTGYVRVVLRHQPNAKNGTYAPGSTDFDGNFQVNIN